MNWEEQLRHTVRVIAAFVWNAHLNRAMEKNAIPQQNFWTVISGSFMDIAAIEWCKLFGSDSEAVHWKKSIPQTNRDGFRKGIYQATAMTPEEWRAYRESIVSYRNEHAAHFDLKKFEPEKSNYPQYDKALEACYYYYNEILEQFKKDGIAPRYPPGIRDFCSRLESCETEIFRTAIEATRDLRESVF